MLKNIFTIVSLGCSLALFIPYYINIRKGTANPHLFSWTTWGLLLGIGFILSYFGGGGAGSWTFGLQSILCFALAGYALFKGEKNIVLMDWIAFISALGIIAIYIFTKNAVLSIILAASSDYLGFVPTFRKSYLKPHNEPALTYFIAFLSFLFSLGALNTYSFVTMFYPSALVVINIALVIFLMTRRKTLSSQMAASV